MIAENKARALGHAFAVSMFLVLLTAVLFFRRWGESSPARSAAAWLIAALMLGDAYLLSRHYFQGLDCDPIDRNPVARFLKERIGPHRHDLATRSGFYNNWLTLDMPYHGCRAFTPGASPRMKEDMRALLERVPPPRVWRLASVRYIVAPAPMAKQIMAAEPFKVVHWFDVSPRTDFQMDVIDAAAGKEGAHCILELAEPNRYALVDQWEIAADDEVLERLASPAFHPLEQVLVPPGIEGLAPASKSGRQEGGDSKDKEPGRIKIIDYTSRRALLEVDTPKDTILRIGEHYDPGWSVLIDGKPSPMFRCDYLFQGVSVPAGSHRVELSFRRSPIVFATQVLVYGICAGALVVLLRARLAEKSAKKTGEARSGDQHLAVGA